MFNYLEKRYKQDEIGGKSNQTPNRTSNHKKEDNQEIVN